MTPPTDYDGLVKAPRRSMSARTAWRRAAQDGVMVTAMVALTLVGTACRSDSRASSPGSRANGLWTFAADRLPMDFRRAASSLGWAVQSVRRDAATGIWRVTLQLPNEQFVHVEATPVDGDRWRMSASNPLRADDPAADAYLDALARTLRQPPARQYGGHFELPPR